MAEAQPEPTAGAAPAAPRRAIVFSGGGARGAYEAGVIRYLLQELPRRLGHPPPIDILCGTSVGAIHACYLAATAHVDDAQARGERVVDFWTSMQLDEVLPISPRDFLRLPARLLGLRRTAEKLRQGKAPERLYGLLNTEALERLVVGAIPWRHIRRNVSEGRIHAVCVAATQIASGRVAAFIEAQEPPGERWAHDPMIEPHAAHLRPTHALASAAIPMLFPVVRVGRRYYADGGLRLNTPLAPALRLGANRILVVGLRQGEDRAGDAALARHRVEDFANPVFLLGKVLNALLLGHVDTDLARMRLINQMIEDTESAFGPETSDRLAEVAGLHGRTPVRRIQDVVIRPSQDLGALAGEVLQSLDPARVSSPLLRFAVRSFTEQNKSPEADLLSYLLFDGEFVRPLAELGFADAKAREEELCHFFSDE